jgi:hypothetical protein
MKYSQNSSVKVFSNIMVLGIFATVFGLVSFVPQYAKATDEQESATIYASKVVCEDEIDLPNWGDEGRTEITSSTAQDWVDSKPEGACEIVDWDFQWAPSGTENPGDNLGNQDSWNTFSGSTSIPESNFGDEDYVWVREVFHSDYVQFTGENTDQDVSAEVYCGEDVMNYDNYDRVQNIEVGKDYYCVGFNALEKKEEEDEEEDEEEEPVRRSRGTSGQFVRNVDLTTSDNDNDSDDRDGDDDDDNSGDNGEVMGATTTFPGLPNAGVAPAHASLQTASSLEASFVLSSLATRSPRVILKKRR